jgi:hypothetical protein
MRHESSTAGWTRLAHYAYATLLVGSLLATVLAL